MRAVLVSALALATCAGGCLEEERHNGGGSDDCDVAADCDDGQTCVDGECVDPAATGVGGGGGGETGSGGSSTSAGGASSTGSGAGSSSSTSGSTSAQSSTSSSSVSSSGAGGGGALPSPGDLVITEIMNNPNAVLDEDGEWFELYNASGSSIDLFGLVIRHDAVDPAKTHAIESSVIVPAGARVVLGNNGDPATNGNVIVSYVYPFGVNLGNTADYLAIERADLVIVDATTWNEVSGLDPAGASRSLSPAALSAATNDDDTTFCEASSFIPGSSDLGTPGAPNDLCP